MFLSDKELESLYDSFDKGESELEPACHFEQGVWEIIDEIFKGDQISFLGDKAKRIEFRSGEITIVAGASGHGKSAFTGQIALDLIRQGKSVCIMSLEMKPERTLWRIARQALGEKLSCDNASALFNAFGSKLILLNHVGSATPKMIYGAIIKAASDVHSKHIIIDNLMRVVNEYGDGANEMQKQFIEKLCALAKALDVHIWVVCHVRKSQRELDQIDKYSVRGSTSITDQADNVLLFIRNLSKEKKIEEHGFSPQVDNDFADNTLVIDKQRNGDWTGSIDLWWDRKTGCFSAGPERPNQHYEEVLNASDEGR